MSSRMLKKAASCVLTSLKASTYRKMYDSPQDTAGSPSRRRAQTWRHLFVMPGASLRPHSRNGASRRAGVGRVRPAAILNILPAILMQSAIFSGLSRWTNG